MSKYELFSAAVIEQVETMDPKQNTSFSSLLKKDPIKLEFCPWQAFPS